MPPPCPHLHSQIHNLCETYYMLVSKTSCQAFIPVNYQRSGQGKKHISAPLPNMTLCETPWINAKEIRFSRREKSRLQNIRCHSSTQQIISLVNLLFSLVKLFLFFKRQNMTQKNTVNSKAY